MRHLLAVLTASSLLVGVAQAQGRPGEEAARQTQRGLALQQQGKHEEAVAEFRRAAEADPGNVSVLMNLAHAYSLQGRIEDAIAEYRKVLAQEPRNVIVQNNLGVLYDRQGRYDEAIEAFDRILKQDPTNPAATKNLEMAKKNSVTAQERDQNVGRAKKAFEARPRDPQAAYGVARAHAIHGQRDEALDWLIKAVDLGYDNVEYLTVDPAFVLLRDDPRFPKRGSH
jgi:tetratricopeptide (TPR) repeat protein